MRLTKISEQAIKTTLYERFLEDFPASERIPLWLWERAVRDGLFETLLLTEDETPVGYTVVARKNGLVFIYYLAIFKEQRSGGHGSAFLSLLGEAYQEEAAIFLEVDRPGLGDTEEENEVRRRRIRFYEKNGFSRTGIYATVKEAHLELMLLPLREADENLTDRDLMNAEQGILEDLLGTERTGRWLSMSRGNETPSLLSS